jgi:hypothetical protein
MVSSHAALRASKLSLKLLAALDALYRFGDVDIWPTKRLIPDQIAHGLAAQRPSARPVVT